MTNDKGRMTVVPPLAGSQFLMLLFRNKLSTTAYAHASMLKTVKFGSKSVKKATFSVKKGSKRRAIRHAHLNISGGHPLWR
jgi:outer membrane lipoprotein-sorting protein